MSLELICKVVQYLPEQTGNGKNGPWVKQDFIVETIENYAKKICMSAWGDQVKLLQSFPPGTTIKASIRIESREYNGRWYTDVRPWKMELAAGATAQAPNAYAVPQTAFATEAASSGNTDPLGGMQEANDDLPF